MLIVSLFSENGIPKPGLSPVITIVDIDEDEIIIDEEIMDTLSSMPYLYIYDFITYNAEKNYIIITDGGDSLNNIDRYKYITNDSTEEQINLINSNLSLIKKIETGRWKIINNQMIFYDEDGVSPLKIYNLKDINGNPTMNNPFERVPAI